MIFKKPAQDGICDSCGAELVQRKDDAPDTVADRLSVYHEQTEPLKSYYSDKNRLGIVDGLGDVADITERVLSVLEDKA